jgi:hypothetical protein
VTPALTCRIHRLAWAAVLLFGGCAAPGQRALTAYVGAYSDNSLPEEILPLRVIQMEHSRLATLAYAETLHSFWQDHGRWEWEVQGVKHWGFQSHWEFNALVALRWRSFPWNELVRTSFAIGNGLSWATEVPALELASHTNEGATQLLNYLLLEWTLGLPSLLEWDLVLRIHHRSGIYGLFDGVNGGSNVLALGLKYRF